MPNGNGKKSNAQEERFKAQVEQHGGCAPICEWNNHSGMVGFTYQGVIYRVKMLRAASPVSMEQRMLHACDAAVAVLQTLETGAEWTFQREP